MLWRRSPKLTVGAVVVLYGVFMLTTKRAVKAGALASLVVLAFFYYGTFSDKLSGSSRNVGWFFALWVALLVVGLVAVLRTKRDLRNLMVIVGVGAAVFALPQAVSIARYHANHHSLSASDPRLWPTAL